MIFSLRRLKNKRKKPLLSSLFNFDYSFSSTQSWYMIENVRFLKPKRASSYGSLKGILAITASISGVLSLGVSYSVWSEACAFSVAPFTHRGSAMAPTSLSVPEISPVYPLEEENLESAEPLFSEEPDWADLPNAPYQVTC